MLISCCTIKAVYNKYRFFVWPETWKGWRLTHIYISSIGNFSATKISNNKRSKWQNCYPDDRRNVFYIAFTLKEKMESGHHRLHGSINPFTLHFLHIHTLLYNAYYMYLYHTYGDRSNAICIFALLHYCTNLIGRLANECFLFVWVYNYIFFQPHLKRCNHLITSHECILLSLSAFLLFIHRCIQSEGFFLFCMYVQCTS